jgi:hypothetical protein
MSSGMLVRFCNSKLNESKKDQIEVSDVKGVVRVRIDRPMGDGERNFHDLILSNIIFFVFEIISRSSFFRYTVFNMYLDIIYILVCSKNNVPRKVRRLII